MKKFDVIIAVMMKVQIAEFLGERVHGTNVGEIEFT